MIQEFCEDEYSKVIGTLIYEIAAVSLSVEYKFIQSLLTGKLSPGFRALNIGRVEIWKLPGR
jgi:hypothetical protein